MLKKLTAALVAFVAGTAPALAHLDPAEHGSLVAGLTHPISGIDHILAMLAVGLWAALIAERGDKRSLWLVPMAFVGTMLLGFFAAIAGAPLPFVEPVILASIVVIGLLAAVALQVRTPAAIAVVGFFAFFHGHAHGGEIGEAGAATFAIGFALATTMLHAVGAGAGVGFGWSGGSSGRILSRIAGALTAFGGLWLAVGG